MQSSTGIVRRIDDLGRVVIPKEIRKMMKVEEGDPLEIFTNKDGSVTFRKYCEEPNYKELWSELKEELGEYPGIIETMCELEER